MPRRWGAADADGFTGSTRAVGHCLQFMLLTPFISSHAMSFDLLHATPPWSPWLKRWHGGTNERAFFISHSSQDDGFVRGLQQALGDLGQDVWIDSRELRGSDPLWPRIQRAPRREEMSGVVCFAGFATQMTGHARPSCGTSGLASQLPLCAECRRPG